MRALLAVFLYLIMGSAVHASMILPGLKGGDLTDPEDDADPSAYVNYDAIFRASDEEFFNSEGAFNVFDNTVGARDAKWCCDGTPVWVEADFGSNQFMLTSFTISSGNDVPRRDPDIWSILGSNDGMNYDTIFSYDDDGNSPFSARLQTVEYALGTDYKNDAAYSIFRYSAFSQVGGGLHQINELEFFGTVSVPEPSILALFGSGLLGLGLARRKQKSIGSRKERK